jgi:hypothetical protein
MTTDYMHSFPKVLEYHICLIRKLDIYKSEDMFWQTLLSAIKSNWFGLGKRLAFFMANSATQPDQM